MATAAPTESKEKVAKVGPDAKLSVKQIVAKMDKALPGWKKYIEDRKKGVAKEKRRNLRDYQTFEHLYGVLRERGLKLKDARKQVAAS